MYTSAALTEHRHRTRMCSYGLTYFHQSADSCVFFYGSSKFPFILKESMKIQQQPPPPSALPCYDKTLSHCISLHQGYFTLSGTLRLRHSLSCLWTSWGKGSWPPLPAWSLFLLWTFHKKKKIPVREYSTETSICLGSLDPRRVHPAASTSLSPSWNITVLHSQIRVSSVSLLRGVKLDLLTSWMQQPGVARAMTASVLGSIQLGIVFFFPSSLVKGGSQDECLANFWNMYLYKRTIKVG